MMSSYNLGTPSTPAVGTAASTSTQKHNIPESEEQTKHRFQVELEFVQCLANPHYLNFLAQRDYFKQDAFVNYLKYLLYWKRPEYAKFLKYPQCLHFLELLQYAEFRDAMAVQDNAIFCEEQQLLQWQFYIRKRARLQMLQQAEENMDADK